MASTDCVCMHGLHVIITGQVNAQDTVSPSKMLTGILRDTQDAR